MRFPVSNAKSIQGGRTQNDISPKQNPHWLQSSSNKFSAANITKRCGPPKLVITDTSLAVPSLPSKTVSQWCPKIVSTQPCERMNFLIRFPGLNSFVEPCFLVYDVPTPALDKSLASLKDCLPFNTKETFITHRCREKRIERIQLINEAVKRTVCISSPSTACMPLTHPCRRPP
jgi:hypothetical protein